ncbi:alpha/beta fold hydrolase [Hylemonella gracilis]|uniref:Alpha/beta hydrolase fold protein n=1 Tax=Hylemonella gracilis ATCC 19624 TaxID=887062 RepID=F3KXB7_9BURK|nr:alpha/beta hydrolase [Hylemonella gracilis]EGI75484.1 alpha/beta hydrolase fold protein [Hylemonella gracilis ATCC 19624]
MYQPRRVAHSGHVPVRTLNYHVLRWGPEGTHAGAQAGAQPPLVLMHGWMDVAASFQFVVDAFSESFVQGRPIIAADWRGFGLTQGPVQDHYGFPDYLADLDFLLDQIAPGQPVDLLGHSMGGNVVMLYAGARPQRIRRLINLEGFGLPATQPEQAPARHATWMDELKQFHRGELALKTYADADGVARRLIKTNPRLPEDKAQWLARQWARPITQGPNQGSWEILGDAAHKIVNPQLYRVEEVRAAYAAITAPVLVVEASETQMEQWWQGRYSLAEFHERLQSVPRLHREVIQDAAHMLHHDQPEQLASLIEDFLTAEAPLP